MSWADQELRFSTKSIFQLFILKSPFRQRGHWNEKNLAFILVKDKVQKAFGERQIAKIKILVLFSITKYLESSSEIPKMFARFLNIHDFNCPILAAP